MKQSPKFELVKWYYDHDRWNSAMVKNAVGRWITKDECDEILKKEGTGNE